MIPAPALIRFGAAALMIAGAMTASLADAAAQQQKPSSASGDSSGGDKAKSSEPKASVAQVGAGTTDGSTTGFSGPKSNVKTAPGENSLTPLPSADACKSYADTPAYQACLWVVLRGVPDDIAGEKTDE